VLHCVTIDTIHHFSGNLVAAQARLRHASLVQRQAWNMPTTRDMEFDQYDNLASIYLVWANEHGVAQGVSRLYPTTLPYMLEQLFPHLVTNRPIPKSETIYEGSRFCINKDLPKELRKKIAAEIVLGYLEYGLSQNIREIVGVMLPIYWRNLFTMNGWPITPFGPVVRSSDGHKIMAGGVTVSADNLANVRRATGITSSVLRQPFEEAKVA
jgi:N-acyl-L-homoserine lactone synthetase